MYVGSNMALKKSQRSLVQYFQPEYSWQVETIPGIKDMIAKFK